MKKQILALALALTAAAPAFAEERAQALFVHHASGCSSGFAAKEQSWQYSYCLVNRSDITLHAGQYYQACFYFQGAGRGGQGVLNVTRASPAAYRVYIGCK